jgi:Ca2+-binding RTX toxin-like protein
MVDYTINNSGTQNGTAGADRLTYNINVAGGVTLTGITGSLAGGYSGQFNGPGSNDANFTAIENFTFNDNIGGADNITTGDGADVINSGGGNDTLNSAGGNDTLNAGTGSDSVNGGAGNDSITLGLEGTDTVNGGTETDTLTVVGGATAVTMTSGTTITTTGATINYSNIENFNITGSSVADTITTGANNDTIAGGSGNDTLNAGLGSDSVNGGANDDRITVSLDGTDTVDGGTETDTLIIVGGATAVTMTSGNSITTSGATINYSNIENFNITGSSVADTITTGANNDTIFGGAGNDTLNAGLGSDSVNGGADDDRITVSLDGTDTVDGGTETDTLVVVGGAAAMTMTSGNSITTSGATINYSNFENFSITGSSAADTITTGANNDTIAGGSGNDTLNAGAGSDSVNGGANDDRITVSLDGTDTVDGGTETDTLVVVGGATAVTMTSGNSITTTGATINYSNIENFNITGSSAADTITTASGRDVLFGGLGDDALSSGSGSDSVSGGAGNDTISIYVDGTDTVDGGADSDVLIVTGAAAAITLNGITGGAGSISGAGTLNFTNFERVSITGSTSADNLLSGSGDDTLNGGSGNDTLNADEGSDAMNGGAGHDTLVIDAMGGTDVVDGGADSDVLHITNTVLGVITGSVTAGTLATGFTGSVSGTNSGVVTLSGIESIRYTDATGSNVTLTFWEGNDAVNTAGAISGGIDFINAGNGNNSVSTGVGADRIISGSGTDSLDAGVGDDTIQSGSGVDTVMGGEGNDLWIANHSSRTTALRLDLRIDPSVATLTGTNVGVYGTISGVEGMQVTTGSGNDTLVGYRKFEIDPVTDVKTFVTIDMDDRFISGAGNDVMQLDLAGEDTVDGGTGTDFMYIFANVNAALTASGVSIGSTSFGMTYTDTLGNSIDMSNVERLRITGSNFDDLLVGGNGLDTLIGGAGNDTLNSTLGTDVIDGGAGNDLWIGSTWGSTRGLFLNINTTAATQFQGYGLFVSIEGLNLTMGDRSDNVTTHWTSAMNDTLRMNGGNDFATMAMGGNDRVFMGTGYDRLTLYSDPTTEGLEIELTGYVDGLGHSGVGSDGDNSLDFTGVDSFTFVGRGDGDDTITTGNGTDRLYGGDGNDAFNGGSNSDLILGGNGSDTIIGGAGNDFLYGGADADVFAFSKTVDHGFDSIFFFEDGVDKIRILNANMSDLTITYVSGDTIVTLDSGTRITLQDVARSSITAADFIFE